MTQNETASLDKLRDHNKFLRQQLRAEQQKSASLLGQNVRLKKLAGQHWDAYLKACEEIAEVLDELDTALAENGLTVLYRKYEDVSNERDQLRANRHSWNELGRRTVEAKADTTKELRRVRAELNQTQGELAQARDALEKVVVSAQNMVQSKDEQLARIADQVRLWVRGELDTMSTIAGIEAEFRGYPLPDAGEWDKERALELVSVKSMLREARKDADTWKTYEAEARGACVKLLGLLGYGGTVITEILQQGHYGDAFRTLGALQKERQEPQA